MENILEILDIPDNTKYWLVRAGQGEEYEDFKKSGIIGLRYDKLTLDEINSIKNKPVIVQEYSTYTNKNGKAIKRRRSQKAIDRDKANYHKLLYKERLSRYYKQSNKSISQIASRIENFIHKMDIGDIVIVPYSSSKKFLVGVINSDTYEISVEEQQKLEANAQNEYEWKLKNNQTSPRKHKVSIARKRRSVKWLNEVVKSELNPKLYYTITMHQSIIDISELGAYIDTILAPMYIKNNKLHLNLRVTTNEPVTLQTWTSLYEILNKIYSIEDNLSIKTRVESEGWITLITEIFNWKTILAYSIFGNHKNYTGIVPYIVSFRVNKSERKLNLEKKKLDNLSEKISIYEKIIENPELEKILKEDIEKLGLVIPKNEISTEYQKQKDSNDLSDEEKPSQK